MALFQRFLERLGLRTSPPVPKVTPKQPLRRARHIPATEAVPMAPSSKPNIAPVPEPSIEKPALALPAGESLPAPSADLSSSDTTFLAEPLLHGFPGPAHAETVLISGRSARSLKLILQDIEKLASWPGISNRVELEKVLHECRATYPQAEKDLEEHLQRGKDNGLLLNALYELGQSHGSDSDKVREAITQMKGGRPDLLYEAKKRLESADLIRRKRLEIEQLQRSGDPISQVKPHPYRTMALRAPPPCSQSANAVALHPQDIRGLSPSLHWLLLIEEVSMVFNESALMPSQPAWVPGRFVGLLLPEKTHSLAPFPMGWQAMEQSSLTGLDHVIQTLLDAPVGVIGFAAQPSPLSWGDRWSFGVLRLIECVMRMMPLNTPAQLRVQMGRLGTFKQTAEWQAVAQNALLHLAEIYPGRARRISCHVEVVRKEESPYNGYVDALAFIWASSDPHARECLARSELLGHCLLLGDIEVLFRTWERLDLGQALENKDWALLLSQPETAQPASLVATLLERQGQAAQADATLWQRYLDESLDHVQNRAIDFDGLSGQVAWLEAWLPPGQTLPPALRLLSLTNRLARLNRPIGSLELPWLDELRTLGDRLLDENAPLVYQAYMNLATHATDRYDFDLASLVLERWQTLPKAVLGLCNWARMQSNLGRQAAFRGDMSTAVTCFDQAIAAFGQLSNPQEGRHEARQTRIYRAMALTDEFLRDAGMVRGVVAETIGRSIPEAIAQCTHPDGMADPALHHLLLRWLVHRPQAEAISAYLAQRHPWPVGDGPIWILIHLYRGFLLWPTDPLAARASAMSGFHLALSSAGQTPITRLQGTCCRAVAIAWGEASWPTHQAMLANLEIAMPHARDRLASLQHFLQTPGDPLKLLRIVLPFSLR